MCSRDSLSVCIHVYNYIYEREGRVEGEGACVCV